ncbi:hypothetical protein EV193_106300 [Herbihabitans rhizosphaerae]|uniref:Transglycosylase SLT domain-containing protein n=1 Tax=Herbihabitans rhizosphaerae TaxID=1872711 RepID=A0A4Q7KLE9_9PSEU|nr:lytic murein transglycosylase [Herbihabitans rhizosphaerae]RZS37064.1 hypothetical protein EV193_106300 [Herbihabitans rhizosphaerae]
MTTSTPPPTEAPTEPLPVPEPPARPPRPSRRALVLVVVALLVLAGGVILWTSGEDDPPPDDPFQVGRVRIPPGAAAPHPAAAPTEEARLRAWATVVGDRTDIPTRTLIAYARAEATIRETTPTCKINWASLAGVGRVESRHGQFGGATIGEDGRVSRPIIGVPLNGSPGVRAIRDTDRGSLDGDQTWDRAVGPMQFLPTTWRKWAIRSTGDGARPDPQNVDDAALASARYLCSVGRDMTAPEGWWRAVLTYNQSVSYGQDVFSGADAYAREAVGA